MTTPQYRFVQKTDAEGDCWLTQQTNKFGDWEIVTGTLRLQRDEAERLYEACLKGSHAPVVTVLRSTRVDKNPQRQIVRTLELDCIVRYRVNLKVCEDEFPEVYDITVEVDQDRIASTIAMLEAELPVEEAEAESKRLADMDDGADAKYEAYKDSLLEQKHRANAADAAADFGMGRS